MANSQKIDEIIDPAALKQMDELVAVLAKSKIGMADNLDLAIKLNNAMGKTTSMSAFAAEQEKAAIAIQKVSKNTEQTRLAEIRLQQAREKNIDKYNRDLAKKEAAEKKASERANEMNRAYNVLSRSLEDARKRAKDIGAQFGVNSKQFQDAAKGVRELDARVKDLDANLGQRQRNVGNYGSAWGGVFDVIKKGAGFLGITFAATAVVSFAKDLFQLAKEAEGVQNAFYRMGNGTVVLEELRKATKGTVSDLELMKLAVRAENFSIPMDVLAKGLQFARTQAVAMGKDVDYMVNSFVDGIGRKSTLVLDNLGISASDLQIEIQKVGDFTIAVGNIIERRTAQMGDNIDTLSDKTGRLTSMWNNAKLAVIGYFQRLSNPTGADMKIVSDMIEVGEKNIENFTKLNDEQRSNVIDRQSKSVATLKSEYEKLNNQYIENNRNFGDHNPQLEKQVKLANERYLAEQQVLIKSIETDKQVRQTNRLTAFENVSNQEISEKITELRQQANEWIVKDAGDQKRVNELLAEADKLQGKLDDRTGVSAAKKRNEDASALKKLELDRQKAAEQREKQIQSELALEQSRSKIMANAAKELSSNEQLSYDERIAASDNWLKHSEEELKFELEKSLIQLSLSTDKIRSEEEFNEKILTLRKQHQALVESISLEGINKEDQARLQAYSKQETDLIISQTKELDILNKRLADGNISLEDYNKEKIAIQERYAEISIQNEIAEAEKLIEIQKLRGLDVGDSERKLAELKMRYSKDAMNAQISDLETLEEKEREIQEARKKLGQELFDLSTTLVNAGYERDKQRVEAEIENLDKRTEKEKNAVNQLVLTQEEKTIRLAEIEARAALQREELEARQRAIQVREAKFKKASDILSIIGNTAVAVTKALPNIPLSIIIGAIGAAQIAQVVATPLPKFWTGTDSSPEGFAHIGEKGTELMIDRSGNIGLSPATDTVAYLQKGTQIIDAEKTKAIFANAGVSDALNHTKNTNNIDLSAIINSNKEMGEKIEKAIKSRPEKNTILTKAGLRYTYSNGKKWNDYRNRNLN